jgi:hypothetical protein
MFLVVDLAQPINLIFVKPGHLLFKTDVFVLLSSTTNMDSLKTYISRYLDVNRKISEINSRANDLRDQRRTVELDLAAAYTEHRDLPEKIELNQSKMVFSMKKPGEWKKGWTLSKKQLEEYLVDILPDRGADVMKEIVRRHEPKLVATDYTFDLKSVE